MHDVKQIVHICDQIMDYNYSYFGTQHDDNSYVRIMLISSDNMLITIDILMQNKWLER